MLRKFGYESNLKLGEDYLYPRIQVGIVSYLSNCRRHVSDFQVPIGCSTELSPEGIQFLSALFEKHDEDKDQCLSPCELANLFSVCPTASLSREVSQSGIVYGHMVTKITRQVLR